MRGARVILRGLVGTEPPAQPLGQVLALVGVNPPHPLCAPVHASLLIITELPLFIPLLLPFQDSEFQEGENFDFLPSVATACCWRHVQQMAVEGKNDSGEVRKEVSIIDNKLADVTWQILRSWAAAGKGQVPPAMRTVFIPQTSSTAPGSQNMLRTCQFFIILSSPLSRTLKQSLGFSKIHGASITRLIKYILEYLFLKNLYTVLETVNQCTHIITKN